MIWRLSSRTLMLRGAAFLHDVLMSAAAYLVALTLRLGIEGLNHQFHHYAPPLFVFTLIAALVTPLTGLNAGIWRYASLTDLVAVIKAATVTAVCFTLVYFVVRLEYVPRSSVIAAWAFMIIFLAGPRAIYRIWKSHRASGRGHRRLKPVLLVGAGDQTEMFIRAVAERNDMPFEIIGVIDDSGRRTGRLLRGARVLGAIEDIPDLVHSYGLKGRRPESLLLVKGQRELGAAKVELLLEQAQDLGIDLLRMPNLADLRDADLSQVELKPIAIEDLLDRDPVTLDLPRISQLIAGTSVLVTGAGGSIGSELSRQLAALGPARLTLVDASEYLLYSIDADVRRSYPGLVVLSRVGNVRERDAIHRLFQDAKPDIVFHAAALKHVPIVEAQPLEGLHTNVIGTRNVADAAQAVGATAMVMVSTDKAVNPTNVMGASKRFAEMYCQALDVLQPQASTRFVTVRFGNVLGSAGSVVPLFEKQLKTGGPITVTHPDIERFFMTIPEACQLVLQAAVQGLDSAMQRGSIFVLDMGKPVKIVDLAHKMIRLSGLRVGHDVKIAFTGLRPGEKLFEELFDRHETLSPTGAAGIHAALPRLIQHDEIVRVADDLESAILAGDEADARRLMAATVKEYAPRIDAATLPHATAADPLPAAVAG
ncbi:nucleoside-diphosphate sugar epimerase/dehydratase [Lichenihabitans sp. Uapishka_5]|uniref:polysaccharide biosynthesis protein n=1 Tax=Lichenihabitans sp. Uapishka_5 TaxID=3037302 RepID=UPI0029E7DE8A|nr:nucleoside-diphosphate sugar epimerase/dehydratase [Lichenihabitans sp. Uapishka_5]MDX7949913.1 nucleoside-diphosphate sugar epimerase/dehydratase [Lichenihabitans sp. Uapishka_5]